MIVSEVLDAIDNINSITIESEINTCRSLLYSYDKMLIIEEYYDGNDIDGFKIFQEGDKLDLIKEDLKKQNEGKSTLNKILFTIPRLIRSIFRLITGQLKKSSEKAKQVSEKYKKVKSEKNFKSAGLIAALTLGIPIVWKGKDITKYVKDHIGKKKPVENKKQSNQQNDGEQKPEQSESEKTINSSDEKQSAPNEVKDEHKQTPHTNSGTENNNINIDPDVISKIDDDRVYDYIESSAKILENNHYYDEKFDKLKFIYPPNMSYNKYTNELSSWYSIEDYINLYKKICKMMTDRIDAVIKHCEKGEHMSTNTRVDDIKTDIKMFFNDIAANPDSGQTIRMIDSIDYMKNNIKTFNEMTEKTTSEVNGRINKINGFEYINKDDIAFLNKLINYYEELFKECATVINTIVEIVNDWVDATNKITIKMNDANFNKAELNTNKTSSTNSNIVGYFPFIISRTYYKDFLVTGLVTPEFIDKTNLNKFTTPALNDVTPSDQGYRYVIFANDGYLFFGINIKSTTFANNVLEKLGMHIEPELLRDKVRRMLNTLILFVVNIHTYNDNGVPDMTSDDFLKKCAEVYYKHYRKQWDSKVTKTEYIDSNGISSLDKDKSTINGIKTTNNIPNEKPKGSIDKNSGIYVIDKFDKSCLSYFLDQILHKGNTNESFASNVYRNDLTDGRFKNGTIKNVTC